MLGTGSQHDWPRPGWLPLEAPRRGAWTGGRHQRCSNSYLPPRSRVWCQDIETTPAIETNQEDLQVQHPVHDIFVMALRRTEAATSVSPRRTELDHELRNQLSS